MHRCNLPTMQAASADMFESGIFHGIMPLPLEIKRVSISRGRGDFKTAVGNDVARK
jgi:hypothetical protein